MAVRRVDSTDVLCGVVVLAVVARLMLPGFWDVPSVQAWTTVFAAVCVQASPYVVLGVALSVMVAALPSEWWRRVLPRRTALAVPVAGLAGSAVPGCECGSVPLACSLMRRGVPTGPALAILLSAPATNPVVIAATAAAFPGQPRVVLARFCGSFALALAVGWLWPARASPNVRTYSHGDRTLGVLAGTAAHDLAQSLGLLAIGAASAATLGVLMPRSVLGALAGTDAGAVLSLAVLAVLLAVCSEADAFIASSLTQFSRTAQLAFMIVGPAADVKLLAMEAGAFGARFTARLAVLTFALAVAAATLVGTIVL